MVLETIEWNESEMNDRAAKRLLQFSGIRKYYLCICVHTKSYTCYPKKSRSITGLNEVTRNCDGSLNAF